MSFSSQCFVYFFDFFLLPIVTLTTVSSPGKVQLELLFWADRAQTTFDQTRDERRDVMLVIAVCRSLIRHQHLLHPPIAPGRKKDEPLFEMRLAIVSI